MDDKQHHSNPHREFNVDSLPGATKFSNETSSWKGGTSLSSPTVSTSSSSHALGKQQQLMVPTRVDSKISVSLERGDENKRTTMSMPTAAALTPAQKIIVGIYNEDAYKIRKRTSWRQGRRGITESRSGDLVAIPYSFLEDKEQAQTTSRWRRNEDTTVIDIT